MKIKIPYVKIQGKWLRARLIQIHGDGNVWFSLDEVAASGWVADKYKQKYKWV